MKKKSGNKSQDKSQATQTNLLDPEKITFSRTSGDLLAVKVDRKSYDRVHVYRCFPFSDSQRYISVRASEDEEIGIIADLDTLEPDQRALVEQELSRRYFTPTVEEVINVKEEFGYSYWTAKTDAGETRFTIHSRSTTIIPTGQRGVIISDIDGNRFLIPDVGALTGTAARVVEFLL